MKFLKSKIILAGGVLVSLFIGAIFVSCHSVVLPISNDHGNSLALPITQSLSEPHCMVQSGNYGLHSVPLATIIPTTASQNNVSWIANSLIWFQNTASKSLTDGPGQYLSSTAEVSLYSYLTNFIAQGLLQPQIYAPTEASV